MFFSSPYGKNHDYEIVRRFFTTVTSLVVHLSGKYVHYESGVYEGVFVVNKITIDLRFHMVGCCVNNGNLAKTSNIF